MSRDVPPALDTAALETATRYLLLRNMAERGSTPAESASFRRQLARMEEKDPELRERADRIAGALPAPPPWQPETPLPEKPSKWAGTFGSIFQQVAEASADRMAESLSGAHRFEPLDRGDVDVKRHDCAKGQVCLEVRVRTRDIRDERRRNKVMEALEIELRHAASEGR